MLIMISAMTSAKRKKRSRIKRVAGMTSLTSRDLLKIFMWHRNKIRREKLQKRRKTKKTKLSSSMNNLT